MRHNAVRGPARNTVISRPPLYFPFNALGALIWGAAGATLAGALAAWRLDLVITAGQRLLRPLDQPDLLRVVLTAALAGLIYGLVYALVRGLGATAVVSARSTPADALSADEASPVSTVRLHERLERAGGGAHYRRFGNAVAARAELAETSGMPTESAIGYATNVGRYDSLYQDPRERRLLMDMLISGRILQTGHTRLRSVGRRSLVELDLP